MFPWNQSKTFFQSPFRPAVTVMHRVLQQITFFVQKAVPAKEDDFIFVSCGTWSLFGTELEKPVLTKQSEELNITNETGTDGKTSFLKNIIGLWLIQESRRQWIREGKEYSFSELEKLAEAAEPFQSFIDPDAPEFSPSGNVPRRIREYCERTGQKIPQTEGEIVRCINESLALKYRYALEEIKACTGKDYHAIHMVGGGIQSKLLCKFTAYASIPFRQIIPIGISCKQTPVLKPGSALFIIACLISLSFLFL